MSRISFGDGHATNGGDSRTRRSGGTRGRVRGFSGASRLRLLRSFAAIDRTAFRAYGGRVFSVTLTYPHRWPGDPDACKGHLKALRKRLRRRFGDFAAFWRLGVQRRGAWHFHVLLFAPAPFGSLSELRRFVSASWYEICGRVSEGHLLAGTRVERLRTWKRASHAGRYLAKREAFPEGLETGRVWGVWNGGLLPVRWETAGVSFEDALKIRRVYRKLAGMRGTGCLHRITVFVRHENVLRLLAFLGYSHE